jgi:ribosomal protein L9
MMVSMKVERQKSILPVSIAGLSPLELVQKISVADAAAHNGVHIDTFKKNLPHLIKRIGKRRLAVTLYDAIVLPPPNTG